MILLPGSTLLGTSAAFLWVAQRGFLAARARAAQASASGAAPAPASSRDEFAHVALVTVGWFLLYFSFLMLQSSFAFLAHGRARRQKAAASGKAPTLAEVKYGGAGGALVLTGDRTVGNMLEQGMIFLPAVWLHAYFVDGVGAALLGWYWLAARAIYPLVFPMGVPMLFLSTLPDYTVLLALLWPVVTACAGAV